MQGMKNLERKETWKKMESKGRELRPVRGGEMETTGWGSHG